MFVSVEQYNYLHSRFYFIYLQANIKEMQSILLSPDGNYIIIKSTAQGESNYIYDRQNKM